MTLVVMVGLPGCGKSTWIKEHGYTAISSDQIRGLLIDDETNQTIHRQVFAVVRELVRRRIALGRPITFIDATNLTPKDRRSYIAMGRRFDIDVEALYFDVPLEICKQRNTSRARVVPNDAMDLMADRLVPPSLQEGFSRVLTISGAPEPIESPERV